MLIRLMVWLLRFSFLLWLLLVRLIVFICLLRDWNILLLLRIMWVLCCIVLFEIILMMLLCGIFGLISLWVWLILNLKMDGKIWFVWRLEVWKVGRSWIREMFLKGYRLFILNEWWKILRYWIDLNFLSML